MRKQEIRLRDGDYEDIYDTEQVDALLEELGKLYRQLKQDTSVLEEETEDILYGKLWDLYSE